jgi:hypothetical protein
MFELKPLSKDAIPTALAKAERYRLLNDPTEAESICLDILQVEPDHQQALVMLVLALTEQFAEGAPDLPRRARDVVNRLASEYEREYYRGIICERRAKAILQRPRSGYGPMAYEWLSEAMQAYERAEAIRPPGNDDAILRWNTCARTLNGNPRIKPRGDEALEPLMLE